MSRKELTDRDYVALARFRRALRQFNATSEQAAKAAGITPQQHQLLLGVRGWVGEEAPSISDLADVLLLRHHSTVELVQRATAAGIIDVHPDPRDARRQRVALTADGREALRTFYREHGSELKRFRQDMAVVLHELDG